MVEHLRRLTDDGLARFRESLDSLRRGMEDCLPAELLKGGDYTELVRDVDKTVASKAVKSKMDVAYHLTDNIDFRARPDLLWDVGLWSWLSVFYFDLVCPLSPQRKIGADYRYILHKGKGWRHYHQHLLAGPVRMYYLHGDKAKLLLYGPINKVSEAMDRLGASQEIACNKNVIEAANILYWDSKQEKPKRGAFSKNAGSLRRFMDVINQFDRTFDLHSMGAEDIVSLLPQEFKEWIS